MGKKLFIAEKPSVAREFAKVFHEKMSNHDGYIESENLVVTWCVGHLVTMSYPDVYDEKYKKWRMETLPFIPQEFKYEVIPDVKKQFDIVSGLLNREDVERIYVCTDSGREGEYIYRLVHQMADVHGKDERRVWIDSQTEDEIKRGIRDARPESEYDNVSAAAYLRAKEDYLMGINFSRALSIKFGNTMANFLHKKYCVISVGRVMTCVLGMVVRREREIRDFTKIPFYRVTGSILLPDKSEALIPTDNPEGNGSNADGEVAGNGSVNGDATGNGASDGKISGALIDTEWKAKEGSKYFNSPLLYKENGFKEERDAKGLISYIGVKPGQIESEDQDASTDAFSEALKKVDGTGNTPEITEDHSTKSSDGIDITGLTRENETFLQGKVDSITKKTEKKNPPLLYNLAEIQNECSKFFKISPDQTLNVIQELYEKKLVTYPRTDARVLSTAVAKEIDKNIRGLTNLPMLKSAAEYILNKEMYKGIDKTKYTDDKKITDHYAIIPTGQGIGALKGMNQRSINVYELICRRFLAIFLSPAEYAKTSLVVSVNGECFYANGKFLKSPGYLGLMEYSFSKKNSGTAKAENTSSEEESADNNSAENNEALGTLVSKLKKGDTVYFKHLDIKEGETSPPKRYNSGSLILAMENAGQLIEDEELRELIKSQGIGTSATRAEILKKLVRNKYLNLNKKTQILTPTLDGEIIFDIVSYSIASLLNADLTASWEKGLAMVENGEITPDEYMDKLKKFINQKTNKVKDMYSGSNLNAIFRKNAEYYN